MDKGKVKFSLNQLNQNLDLSQNQNVKHLNLIDELLENQYQTDQLLETLASFKIFIQGRMAENSTNKNIIDNLLNEM